MTEKDNRSVALSFLKELAGPDYQHLPKYIAYLGMTITIKGIIEATEEVTVAVSRLDPNVWLWKVTDPEKLAKELDMPVPEMLQWLSAFTFSYLIVENFDALLALGGNLVGAVRLLAGL